MYLILASNFDFIDFNFELLFILLLLLLFYNIARLEINHNEQIDTFHIQT